LNVNEEFWVSEKKVHNRFKRPAKRKPNHYHNLANTKVITSESTAVTQVVLIVIPLFMPPE